MATFLLNEWFWADCSGERGGGSQREAVRLLIAFVEGADRVVFVRGCPAERKLWALCRNDRSKIEREICRAFKLNILYSTNCIVLDADQLPPLPPELEAEVKADDRYLVQAQIAVTDCIVITSDGPLLATLQANGRPAKHRDDFLLEYFSNKAGQSE